MIDQRIFVTLFLIILYPTSLCAEELRGRVVGISDGDTLTLLDDNQTQHRVRLAGIDAPESAMEWGSRAKKALSQIVFRQHIAVFWTKKDRYGRILGKVMFDGKDINLHLVAQGMAWHYKKYQNEQTLEDRDMYSRAENESRLQQKGLWSDPHPIPPWEWRRARKSPAASYFGLSGSWRPDSWPGALPFSTAAASFN